MKFVIYCSLEAVLLEILPCCYIKVNSKPMFDASKLKRYFSDTFAKHHCIKQLLLVLEERSTLFIASWFYIRKVLLQCISFLLEMLMRNKITHNTILWLLFLETLPLRWCFNTELCSGAFNMTKHIMNFIGRVSAVSEICLTTVIWICEASSLRFRCPKLLWNVLSSSHVHVSNPISMPLWEPTYSTWELSFQGL